MSAFNNMQSNSVNRQSSYYNRRAAKRRRQRRKRRLLLLTFVLIVAVITVIVITLANKPDTEIIGVWQFDFCIDNVCIMCYNMHRIITEV